MSKNRAINWQRASCRVAVLALVLAALPTYGADVYRGSNQYGTIVRLFDDPCPVASGWLKMKKAEVFFEGKIYAACWIVQKNVVIVIDEGGDVTPHHVSAFKKEEPDT